ncbi:MAG: PilW family protein [Variovorax sp.]|nr:PilW family protein [Variovorax sp.]
MPPRGSNCRGFTLVELMVAIALGLLLLIALVSLLVSTVNSRNELDKTTRQIDNGRYALQVLTENIQLAGFVGASASTAFSSVAPVGCPGTLAELGYTATTNPGTSVVPYPVYRLDTVPACIDHVVPGTAMLLLTRVSTTAATVATADKSEEYLQVSTCATDTMPFAVASGASTATFALMQKDCTSGNLAPLRKIVQQLYYVSSCNECGTDTIPTLKVAELQKGAIQISAVVEGIENFQVDFGVDMDGNGSPDCYTSNPDNPPATEVAVAVCPQTTPPYDWTQAVSNWSNVMAVRVHVLGRQIDTSAGTVDTKKYDMGLATGTVGPFKDAYKRTVYSTVARLYNPSGQRETP